MDIIICHRFLDAPLERKRTTTLMPESFPKDDLGADSRIQAETRTKVVI